MRFDAQASGVGALSSLQPAGFAQNQRQLTDSLQAPTNYLRRGYTRFDLGLREAIHLLEVNREPNRSQYVLRLTDGEPTEPGGGGGQKERVAAQIAQLRAAGVLIFPVVFCNSTTGCSGNFLREQFSNFGIREATTAQDLLRVFSEIFAEMKPDRSVITERTRSTRGRCNSIFVRRKAFARFRL